MSSAEKQHKQSLKRRLRNRSIRSTVRTYVKKFYGALSNKNNEEAKLYFHRFTVQLDKAAQKGIYHKQTAARKKSRLAKKLHNFVSTV